MKPSAFAGHRKIIHIGIDGTIDPVGQAELQSLLCEYTDLVEFTAASAAFLDVTYNTFDIPFGARVARMIKGDIKRQLGMGVSLGLGPTKFIAKIAMASARPDGLTVVLPEQVDQFLANEPIDLLPGVGTSTRQLLAEMGVETIGQLPAQEELARRFGQRGHRLWSLARGVDDDPVAPTEQPNQIVEQRTFEAPVYDGEEIRDALRELAAALSGRLRRRGLRGRLVGIEAHYPGANAESRTAQLPDYTDAPQTLLATSIELLRRTEASAKGVRLLGLGLGGFAGEAAEQLDLFA